MKYLSVCSGIEDASANCYGDGTVYRNVRSQDSEIETLIMRKPIGIDEILNAFEDKEFDPGHNRFRCFIAGVRFAEKYYGIGGGDD